MAQQTFVWQISVTVPANRPYATNPLITPVNLGDIWCDSVELDVPPGAKGQAGIFLSYDTTYTKNPSSFVPWATPATGILADAQLLRYDYGGEIPGAFAIWQYNTDVVAHLVQVRIIGYYMVQGANNTGGAQPVQVPISA